MAWVVRGVGAELVGSAAFAGRSASDDGFDAVVQGVFEPCRGSAGPAGGVEAFTDNAFDVVGLGQLEQARR